MKTFFYLLPAVVITAVMMSLGHSQQSAIDLSWGSCEERDLKTDTNHDTICWAGADACRIFAVGSPSKKANSLKEKRDFGRDAAVIMAKYHFILAIMTRRMELLKKSCPVDCEIEFTDSNPPQKAFKYILDKGVVVEEIFSPDDSCRVVYEIREKNLKKIVGDYLKRYEEK